MRKKYLNYHCIARTILSLKKNMLHPETVRQEKREITFYSKFIKRGDLCFDVGANIGNKTNIFLKLGAKVVAIEPQKLACRKINKFYGDNKNLVVINKGLAANPGFLELSIGEDYSVLSTMSEEWRKKGGFSKDYKWTKTEKVSVVTLDNLISEYGLPKFCKIDVEGFEEQVLKGLSQPIPYISFEFRKTFLEDAKKCTERLMSLNSARFNFSLGESAELFFKDWTSYEELFGALEKIEDKDLWGDIYVAMKGHQDEVRLHLGCGGDILPGYTNIDNGEREGVVYNINSSILDLKFVGNSVNEIRLHHVFEHFHRYQAPALMATFNQWLKPGGILIIETPDFEWCCRKYLGFMGPMDLIWNIFIVLKLKKNYFKVNKWKVLRHVFGSKEADWANHYEGWDKFTLSRIFKLFGFTITQIKQSKYRGWATPNIVVTGQKERHIGDSEFNILAKQLLEPMVINEPELGVWLKQAEELKNRFSHNQETVL